MHTELVPLLQRDEAYVPTCCMLQRLNGYLLWTQHPKEQLKAVSARVTQEKANGSLVFKLGDCGTRTRGIQFLKGTFCVS